jgi:hypothetical protein
LIPTLPREAKSELAQLYEGALRDHDETAAADALPAACPYGLDQITGVGLPK